MKFFFIISVISISFNSFSQSKFETNKKDSEYKFKVLKDLEATDVQDQGRTSTCWSFSSLSFFESEIIRIKKERHNLSEMFIVRNAYLGKAENYLRMYGTFTFGPGGAFHDIPWVIKRYGIVPEEVYGGLNYGASAHKHSEMEAVVESAVKALAKKPQNGKLTPVWKNGIEGILDAYLGELPSNIEDYNFTYKGEKYTPKTFSESLGLNMEDYISLTSFTHHPFYSNFVLEVQDNWALQSSYNLPLDEFMEVMESALMKGYTFAWGADVSEKGFGYRDALAILPEDESTIKKSGKDSKRYNDAGAERISNAFNSPVKEKQISQKDRQIAFDNQETTDDHGMHVTGLVEDQNGTKYFIVKNSWGESNEKDGYFFASFPYVRYKTLNIQVHKDVLSKDLKKKLGIK
ncbi:MAG: aminopeptidase [Flavobacteriales bacterium]|nr:aminopeptidase [Flavobacteriales bacterium]